MHVITITKRRKRNWPQQSLFHKAKGNIGLKFRSYSNDMTCNMQAQFANQRVCTWEQHPLNSFYEV